MNSTSARSELRNTELTHAETLPYLWGTLINGTPLQAEAELLEMARIYGS